MEIDLRTPPTDVLRVKRIETILGEIVEGTTGAYGEAFFQSLVRHFAGALGRPVWLVAAKGNGRLWYWFSGRTDSPWYPSMRIFSQRTPGSWRETLDAVARDLAALVKRQ